MKTKALAACILLAAFGAACSGGGGSSPAPKSVATSSGTSAGTPGNTVGAAVPNVGATMPPGTVGVTLNLRIPAHKTVSNVRLKPSATRKQPAFIQSQTNGVVATVTPSSGSPMTTSGSCLPVVNPTSCTIVVPIPIAFSSTVVVQLLEGATVIGQATASFTANQFSDGVAQTYGTTLTFQPLIQQVLVTWYPNPLTSPGTFYQNTAAPTFAAQLVLLDPANNDVGGETDGVLDMSGNPITTITIGSFGLNAAPALPASVNVSAGNPASDVELSSSITPDGTSTQPDIQPSGGNNVSYVSLSQNGNYSFVYHNFSVMQPGSWNGNNYIEYPSPQSAPSPAGDTFTMNEAVQTDATYVTLFLDMQNGVVNPSSSCATIGNFAGFSANASPPYQYLPIMFSSGTASYTVSYNTGNFNGVCMLEFADGNNVLYGVNNSYDFTISVNNPTIVIQRKVRK